MNWQRLGEILLAQGQIGKQQWEGVLKEHQRWGSKVPQLIMDRKLIDEHDLIQALSQLYNTQAVNLDQGKIPREVLDLISVEEAEQYEMVPFRRDGRFLDVATVDPANHDAVDTVRARTGLNVRTYVAGPHMVQRAIARYYGRVFVGGYAVDPRVTSGMFLRGDIIDFESARGPRMQTEEPVEDTAAKVERLEARVADQDKRIAMLEALIKRDEDVLRRLCGLLIDKKLTTRDELVALLK